MMLNSGFLPWSICLMVFAGPLLGVSATCNNKDVYSETLRLKSLENGLVHAMFEFVTNTSALAITDGHYNLFPKALGEVINKYSVEELEIGLTQGNWRYSLWGFPPDGGANPSGASILALFKSGVDANTQWKGLVNSLSGLVCASLNFMDEKSSVTPTLSFNPRGALMEGQNFDHSLLKYAVLAQENVCTENLTPFKKLLPCFGETGISSLLNAKQLFDSHYHSMSITVRSACTDQDCTNVHIQLKQTISVVLNYYTKGSKKKEWSIRSLFGSQTPNKCHVAQSSTVELDVLEKATLEPAPVKETKTNGRKHASYNFGENFSMLVHEGDRAYVSPTPPQLHAHRYMAGYGLEKASIVCEINNRNDETVQIVYTEYLPWFIRVYLHTMQIENSDMGTVKPAKIAYVPGLERKNPNLFEVLFTLPPNSTTVIRFEVEKLFLKWTEYPPDANLGFYIPSSIILAVLPDAPVEASIQQLKNGYGVVRLYTEKLLVALPTPDFSMPYNVICLACTVVAIAFGSFHNLTTKTLIRETEKKPSFPQRVLGKIKSLLGIKSSEQEVSLTPAKKRPDVTKPPKPKKKVVKTVSIEPLKDEDNEESNIDEEGSSEEEEPVENEQINDEVTEEVNKVVMEEVEVTESVEEVNLEVKDTPASEQTEAIKDHKPKDEYSSPEESPADTSVTPRQRKKKQRKA